jgi:hypothetical protein
LEKKRMVIKRGRKSETECNAEEPDGVLSMGSPCIKVRAESESVPMFKCWL